MPLTGDSAPVVWSDPAAPAFELALADIVNQPGLNQVIAPNADPLLAPPLYGRWHAGRAIGDARRRELARLAEPRSALAHRRRRSAREVIQEHQEALMASAWEQAAEIQPVNQRLRQLQMSMAVGESLHARHLSPFTRRDDAALRVAGLQPHPRADARPRSGGTHADGDDGGHVAAGAGDAHGDAAHRQAARAADAAHRREGRRRARSSTTWVARLNLGNASGRSGAARRSCRRAVPPLPTVDAVVDAIWNSGFQVAAENQPLPPLPAVDPLPPGWDYPGHFRKAAADHLARLRPRISASFIPHITMSATVGVVRAQMHPRVALANLARAAISTGDNVLPPTAPGVTPVGTETVMMAPSFPQPMYEALKEKSQELLLPGLDTVLPDTVLGLRTNRAFVEAYMIGLNVEMARELLWRGFPTDQRGTYFRNFWGTDGAAAAVSDIGDLRAEPGPRARHRAAELAGEPVRAAAAQQPAAPLPERDHLSDAGGDRPRPRRRPTSIRSSTARWSPTSTSSASRSRQAQAIGGRGNPGYYVVIQEHPTEPRFGLDAPVTTALLATKSHLAIGTQPPAGVPLKGRTWGRNSAHMADITRRLPVRITIHASQLVSLT